MSKVLIIKNKDKRMDYIKKILEKYLDVIEIEDELTFYYSIEDKECSSVILPIRGVNHEQIIDGTDIHLTDNYLMKLKNKTIYTGLISTELKTKCEEKGVSVRSYLSPDLAIKNNYITTEGIIEAIVINSDKAIFNSKILIIGYGKLGQISAKVLQAMKGNITVSCRHEKDILHAKINEYEVVENKNISHVIDQFDFIINTIPYHLLDNRMIKKLVDKKCLIIDVASLPYGLNHDYAKGLGINVVLLPGIPGKIAPQTAGELIGHYIYHQLNGGEE